MFQDVNPFSPINWSHTLNRGRMFWLLAEQGTFGGNTCLELVSRRSVALHGSASANGWRGTNRPGGYGHLLFDGSAGYASAPIVPPTVGLTLAVWLKTTANTRGICGWNDGSTPNGNGDRDLGVTASGFAEFYVYSSGFLTITASTKPINDGNWHRIVGTVLNGTQSLYVDKVLVASGSCGALNQSMTSPYMLLGNGGTSGFDRGYIAGTADDLTASSRGWTAAEVALDYDLSRRGYPGVLNRLSLFLPQPRLFNPVWAQSGYVVGAGAA